MDRDFLSCLIRKKKKNIIRLLFLGRKINIPSPLEDIVNLLVESYDLFHLPNKAVSLRYISMPPEASFGSLDTTF